LIAFENRKIEGLRQFFLDAWTEMTANSEFARNTPGGGVRQPPSVSNGLQ